MPILDWSSDAANASTMRPCSITRITSASRIVDSRWAMTKEVRSLRSAANAFCSSSSVRVSTEEVASSKISSAGSERKARARARWTGLTLNDAQLVEIPARPIDYSDPQTIRKAVTDILAQLRANGGDMAPMAGMNGDPSSAAPSPSPSPPPSPTGDAVIPGSMHSMNGISMSGIIYPHYLINGRLPTAPVTLTGKPGQRVRIRFVNAGSDTAFRVALGGHRLTVTHTDGFALTPTQADALIMGMGERWDVIVTLKDGVFPLMAIPEGKAGEAMALVRTGSGRAPDATVRPSELSRYMPFGLTLAPAPEAALPRRVANRIHKVVLEGRMDPYRWTINGRSHPDVEPFAVSQGDRVRLRIMNRSKMFHPWHIHGHTFALAATGMRKDTVLLRPMQAMNIEFEADNPGLWMAHCHNLYHAETGMMGTIAYQR